MKKLTIKDVDLNGKRVIVRVDFNVPLDGSLHITDDRRIQSAVPTIRYILDQGAAKVILMSHLGRPKGQVRGELRLAPVGKRLKEIMDEPVLILNECVGPEVKTAIENSAERIILLENLRFHIEEVKNDAAFAKQLADLADIYVNDAFGTAHRAHASTAGVPQYLTASAGFLLEKEMTFLSEAVENPAKPFVLILGGAKVSDKIMLIEQMLPKVDAIIIGGGMAYTFLQAQGIPIGKSLLEEEKIDTARFILEKAKEMGVEIALTSDFVVVEDFGKPEGAHVVDEIPENSEGIDIGPKTRERFKQILSTARTIVWNGPVGVFEVDAFAQGTKEIAEYLSGLKDVTSIVGGGDTAAAVAKFNCEKGITHISTGGGASLELLEGNQLPGIAALTDNGQAVKVD